MSIYMNCSYSFYGFLMLYIQISIKYLQITFKMEFICFVFIFLFSNLLYLLYIMKLIAILIFITSFLFKYCPIYLVRNIVKIQEYFYKFITDSKKTL